MLPWPMASRQRLEGEEAPQSELSTPRILRFYTILWARVGGVTHIETQVCVAG